MSVGCAMRPKKTTPVLTSTPIKRRRDSSSDEEEVYDKRDKTFNLSNAEDLLDKCDNRYVLTLSGYDLEAAVKKLRGQDIIQQGYMPRFYFRMHIIHV